MGFDNLTVDRDGATALLTVNRPHVLNALNATTIDELRRAALDLRHDAAVRAIVVTGSGDKAFVAGADISELGADSPADARVRALRGQHVFDLLERLGKPVIAAVNGFALGGGCELAMACTLRIASETAQFGQPEINLGLIPGFAGTQRLTRLVGKGVALDLLLSGRRITAAEALAIGLVNRVVPAAELLNEARRWADELAGKPARAVESVIEAVNRGADLPFEQAEALEAALFGLLASTADMKEGTAAFLEKRAPRFRGE
jgi:enoyl-CoA hydratase